MKFYRTALIALTIAFTANLASARIITVNRNGGAQYTTIQAAVDAASTSGDEIIVQPGVYTGTGNVVVDLGSKTVILRSNSGPENTIIDGQNARAGIWCVNFESGREPIPSIIGFTIRNGVGVDQEASNGELISFGGGMQTINTSPRIVNCVFRNNVADRGGGLYCESFGDRFLVVEDDHSRPILQNCSFENNRAGLYGGGLAADDSTPELSNCVFLGNSSQIGAGGIHNHRSPTISTDCIFSRNIAQVGGAVLNYESNPRFTGCEFVNNVATAPVDIGGAPDLNPARAEPPGGAIHNETGLDAEDSVPAISGSSFCGNQTVAISPADSWSDLGGNQFCEPEGVGPFRRGNSNGDANLDLSDAIATLRFLFLGAEPPACQAAADSNGDGNIDLTDAVYSLNFLFLAREALPAPTECGLSELESDISLGCENGGCE